MKLAHLHPWNVTPKHAIAIQERLRALIITRDELGPVRFVAGIDVGYGGEEGEARAAAAMLSFPELDFSGRIASPSAEGDRTAQRGPIASATSSAIW